MNVLQHFHIPPPLFKKPNVFFSIIPRSLFFTDSIGEKPPFLPLPSPAKLASFIDNCLDADSLKKLHACILTRGFDQDSCLGSKLLSGYAKLDLLPDSRWVFRRIIEIDRTFVWNPVFVGYFRASQYREVLGLYLELKRRKLDIYGSAVIFTLKSCDVLGDLKFGRSVHLDVVKLGLNTDKNIGSSFVKLYSENGAVEDAAKVFDEITERDVVVYTVMITGYTQFGYRYACEAFRIVREMQRENIEPNRVTLISLLQAASSLGAVEEGNAIHGYALRRGIGCTDDVFVTTLMDMYIKCEVPERAIAIFVNIPEKSIGSWNASATAHLRLGQSLEALGLFVQIMTEEKHKPDQITISNALSSCANLRYLFEGKSIHAYILRSGFVLDLITTTTLIDMYLKCNSLVHAEMVFDKTDHKDVILFNVMITGYIQNGLPKQAGSLFYEMLGMGFKPNTSTIISVLSAISDMKDVRQGNIIHGFLLKTGLESTTDISNQLIEVYSRCGLMESASQVFGGIECKDIVSWTSAMMGHVNNGQPNKALILFRLMQREKIDPDSVTFVALLQAIAQVGCLSFARETHARAHRLLNVQEDTSVVNSMITAYSRCGDLSAARSLFGRMPGRNLASWNTIISAYGAHGDCVQALELFNQMRVEKVGPDHYTFTSLLSACSHAGLLPEGLSVFKTMTEEHRLVPSDEHFGCVVDLLSRGGMLEEAFHLLNCVLLRENSSALGTFIASCLANGNAKMGERVGRRLLSIEPGSASAYGLVSNLYAGQAKWEEVAQMGTMTREKGLRRVSGRSFVENIVL
ncbi:hypothetical protein DM860_008554 [Cuscuta australis]|uniref:Pentacotripeptide-repeat region of PRORP domain-containing protein n=1 Tax=Cuscuta australis TaxID=267555 RepID=A0A328D5N2_9ASTE|nr:hypothetical protein DM860_008554 [Cuscuta australis]